MTEHSSDKNVELAKMGKVRVITLAERGYLRVKNLVSFIDHFRAIISELYDFIDKVNQHLFLL